MANTEDIRKVLASLLKAGKINVLEDNLSKSDLNNDELDHDDEPLDLTKGAFYRDEQGNLLPSVATFIGYEGRPVFPHQVAMITLSNDWSEQINAIISSSHHMFALMACNNSSDDSNSSSSSSDDFPKVGTLVRLLSSRSGADETNLIVEGLERVSPAGHIDPFSSRGPVRYPEIEQRIADKLKHSNQVANHIGVIEPENDIDNLFGKIRALLKKQAKYAKSLGLVLKRHSNPIEFTLTTVINDECIGRISRKKLNKTLEFLGFTDLDEATKEEIALFLSKPTPAELTRLKDYYLKAKVLYNGIQAPAFIKRSFLQENPADPFKVNIMQLANARSDDNKDASNKGNEATADSNANERAKPKITIENADNILDEAFKETLQQIFGNEIPEALNRIKERNKHRSNLSDKQIDELFQSSLEAIDTEIIAKSRAVRDEKSFLQALDRAKLLKIFDNIESIGQIERLSSINRYLVAVHPETNETLSTFNINLGQLALDLAALDRQEKERAKKRIEVLNTETFNFSVLSNALSVTDTNNATESAKTTTASDTKVASDSKSKISPEKVIDVNDYETILAETSDDNTSDKSESSSATDATASQSAADSAAQSSDATQNGAQADAQSGTGNESEASEALDEDSKVSETVAKVMERINELMLDSKNDANNKELKERRNSFFTILDKIDELEAASTRNKHISSVSDSISRILKDYEGFNEQQQKAEGINVGVLDDKTSVVTMPKELESSQELLDRLNELQKEHAEALAKAQKEAESKAKKEKASAKSKDSDKDTSKDSKDSKEDKKSSGTSYTKGVIPGSEEAIDNDLFGTNNDIDFKSLVGIATGDPNNVGLVGSQKESNKAKIERATKIRSKIASLLGGRVIFSSASKAKDETQRELEIRAYMLGLTASIQELSQVSPLFNDDLRRYVSRLDMSNPSIIADCAAYLTQSSNKDLQKVLETIPILPRLKLSFDLACKELSAARLQDKIKQSVAERVHERQRQYMLQEQLKEIKKELGLDTDERDVEVKKFKDRMAKLNPPDYIIERFNSEIDKLSLFNPNMGEFSTICNYLDVLTSIPWGIMAKDVLSTSDDKNEKDKNGAKGAKGAAKTELDVEAKRDLIKNARIILDEDHEGLSDVKDRILEYIAVGAMRGSISSQIILLSGPPGVGKTSIGKSIAKALGRPFYRISLGGVDDVSEIKGHRKTYIGAMPGKLVAALTATKVMNPVIMLDEIDKLGRSSHGDPDAALLETLDPEQNKNFMDHYLDEHIDLSQCLFICTANNSENVSPPLLDRMDPIRLSGYIAKEKFEIAKKHLLPRALKNSGLNKRYVKISDETIMDLIEGYARESGVRSLERNIAKLMRKVAVKVVTSDKSVTITSDSLEEYLGTAPFKREKMLSGVGVTTGLAWTSVGGATLPVESIVTDTNADSFKLTGKLGEVMKESANIAYSFMRSQLPNFAPKDKSKFFNKKSIHLHVPEGAIPKDGPSAGVTMASSLLSLALDEAPLPNFGMTGELTLTGHVLPIGGLREKVIAARRMGIFDIIIPIGNEGDMKELPDHVRAGVTFYLANTFTDAAFTLFKSVKESLTKSGKAPETKVVKYDALKPEPKAKASKTTKAKATATAAASKASSATKEATKASPAKASSTKASTVKAKASTAKASAKRSTTKTAATSDNTKAVKKPATKAPTAKAPTAKASAAKATVKTTTAAKKPAAKATTDKATASKTAATKSATTAKKATATKATTAKKPAAKAVATKTATAAKKATATKETTAKKPAAKKPAAKAITAKAKTTSKKTTKK